MKIEQMLEEQLNRQMDIIRTDIQCSGMTAEEYAKKEELWSAYGEHVLTYGGPTIWIKDGILHGNSAGVHIDMAINKV